MVKWLIKSTNEIRLETKEDVDIFHQNLEEEAYKRGYNLSAWSETKKEVKEKCEVIGEFYLCKWTYIFDNAKDPVRPFSQVEYSFNDERPF